VRHAGVKTVVQAVALEVNILGYAVVEWIIAEIIAVQFARQIRVPYIINLRNSCQSVPGRSVGFDRDRRRLEINITFVSILRYIISRSDNRKSRKKRSEMKSRARFENSFERTRLRHVS